MNDKLTAEMVGRLFHHTEDGIKDLLKRMGRSSEPRTVFDLSLPWKVWGVYLVAGGVVWYLWPNDKAMPNEIWIGVLSFEGLLAALLATIAPTTISAGVLPFVIKFFGALDAKMGEQLSLEVQQVRNDPTHTGNASGIINALIAGLNSMLVLPLPLLLRPRWLAVILAVSLCWTVRRIIPDVTAFVLTAYGDMLPGTYWVIRPWHKQLSYCPVCKGEPQTATWPPPRTIELPQRTPQP